MGLALGAVAASAGWGALHRFRSGEVVWLPAVILSGVGAVFAPLGRWLAKDIDPQFLLGGFSLLVMIVAIRMWRQAVVAPAETQVLRAGSKFREEDAGPVCRLSNAGQFELRLRCVYCMIVGGCVAGLLSGFFGVGGGFIIVPLLVLLTQVSMRQAVGTSLLVIAIVSSAGFVSYLQMGSYVSLQLLLKLVAGGLIGMLLGSYVARYIAGPSLQKLFAVAMVLLTVISLTAQSVA